MFKSKWLFILVLIFIELVVVYQVYKAIQKKQLDTVDIFTLNKKYYQYHLSDSPFRYFYQLKPNLGAISDLTSLSDWVIHKPTYHINNDGLNSLKDYQLQKPPGTFRIVALGDSFTFGLFLSTQYAWPQVLEKQLNANPICKNIKQFQVINLGIGGYDLTYDAEHFRLKGLKYKPDLVIWLLRDGNYTWVNELVLPILNKYGINTLANSKQNTNTGFRLFKTAEATYDKKYSRQYRISYSKKSLVQLGKLYQGKLLILNLPQYSSAEDIKNTTLNFVQERKDTYFSDQLPDILHLGGTFPETHPNEKGDKLIASSIFSYLSKNSDITGCEN